MSHGPFGQNVFPGGTDDDGQFGRPVVPGAGGFPDDYRVVRADDRGGRGLEEEERTPAVGWELATHLGYVTAGRVILRLPAELFRRAGSQAPGRLTDAAAAWSRRYLRAGTHRKS